MIELARIGGLSSVVQKGNKTAPEKKGIYAFLWPNIELMLVSQFSSSGDTEDSKTPSRMEQYRKGVKKLRRFKYDGDIWITERYASLLGGKIKRTSKNGYWLLVDSDDARKASQRLHRQLVSEWNSNDHAFPKAMGYHGWDMDFAKVFVPAHKGKIKGKKPNARRVAARNQTRYDAKPRFRRGQVFRTEAGSELALERIHTHPTDADYVDSVEFKVKSIAPVDISGPRAFFYERPEVGDKIKVYNQDLGAIGWSRVRYQPTINASRRVAAWWFTRYDARLSDALSKAFPTYADDSYYTFDELAEGIISGVEEILDAAVSNLVQRVEQTKKDRRFEMGRQVETVISHPVQRGYGYEPCYAYEEIVHPDSVTWTVHGRVNVAKAVQDTLKETARKEKIDLRKLSGVWKTVSGYYERAIWEYTVGSIETFEDTRWNPSNSGDMYESVWKAWESNIHMSFSTSDEDPSCADMGELSLPDEREEKWRFWRGDAKATGVGEFDLPYKAEVEIEGTGNSHAVRRAASRVAAKYKNKKQVDKADGSGKTTVYEYSKGQVDYRNREKAKRIEKLKSQIGKLRSQLKSDLKSDDPKTKLTALAVCLMDQTCERVGNDNSVKERGHFGVTTLQAKHVKIRGGKATLTYKGKSGVDQKKTVTDAVTVKALKDAIKGKSGSDTILCEGDDCTVRAADVNKYLKKYDITAKDIRGFRANDEMVRQLEKHRKGKLPEDKKEREKKLKEEFDAALEATAAVVGHEASTLKNQYLVPKMEDQYKGDGTVMKKWDKKASSVSNTLAGLTANIKMVDKMLKILPTDDTYQTMRFLNGFWLELGKDALKAIDIILNTKEIPPKRNKAVEMAIRITSKAARTRGTPNRFEQWWQKNKKRYDVLIEALSFPEKKMGGESLFKIGPLTVHNTIGSTGKDLNGFKKALRKAVSLIKKSNGVVPGGLSKVLYGEVYYVGNIKGSAHHAAYYDPSQDRLYIRPPKASWGLDIVETIIHEFGHRYYRKFLPKDEKWKWQMHHETGVFSLGIDYDVKPLEIGEQMPLRVKGAPRGWRPSVSKVEKHYYYYETWDGREDYTSRYKMDDFRRTQERKKALYPTVYSTTNEEEHFCEALARVCSGNLSKPHLDAFHAIFSGKKSKKASVARIASRYLSAGENEPTNPGLWAKVISLTKGEIKSLTHNGKTVNGPNDGKGFQKYPTAYANGWASKTYGDLGGGWKKKEKKAHLIFKKTYKTAAGKHTLPKLPYAYDALEPWLSEETLKLHHDKHHKGYVDGLNSAEEMLKAAKEKDDYHMIRQINEDIAFHWGGHYLHTVYWECLGNGIEASDSLKEEINEAFGSWDSFREQFQKTAESVQGSGWAVLTWNKSLGMQIAGIKNHEHRVLWNSNVIFPFDVWEHAYYVDHRNDRTSHFEKVFDNCVNWNEIENRLQQAKQPQRSASVHTVTDRFARGKAKKDVGHGGLDEWFSGHGGAKGKGENATWGDWVSISPVTKTLPSGKKVEKGDIVGDCGISSDPDWKEETKGGKNPLKCMPRSKAHGMPKKERADKAKAKQKAEKSTPNSKKPTNTPTFKKKAETTERWVKLADLNPQLGWPGGTCHVVERIRDEVRNPRTREHLVEKVEDGDKLTNPEANKIYDMQSDRGSKVKFLQRMAITPHAQYRMDQRGITVNDLRMSLNNFGKAFYDSKSRNGYQYKKWTEEISWGKEIRWVDEKNGDLVLVFKADGRGGVLIITTFWEGMSDPKPSTCKVADRYSLSNM